MAPTGSLRLPIQNSHNPCYPQTEGRASAVVARGGHAPLSNPRIAPASSSVVMHAPVQCGSFLLRRHGRSNSTGEPNARGHSSCRSTRGGSVTKIAADSVDAYVFRMQNGLVQFLLLQRRPGRAMGGTWHGIHGKIEAGDTALESAKRAVYVATGLNVEKAYSADYINQFFEPETDTIVLAPVLAFTVPPVVRIGLSEEYVDFAWFDTEEATARLLFASQRWAIRHIEEVIALSGDEAEYYRIH